jgi:uncharacterized protein (DUF1800 family)
MYKCFPILVTILINVTLLSANLEAASTRSGFKIVDKSKVRSVSVIIKDGKKDRTFSVQCLGKTPGFGRAFKGGKIKFTSFSEMIKGRSTKKQREVNLKLKKAGGRACASSTTPQNPNPPAPIAEHLSLDTYTGTFAENEARILLNRFAFGGNPNQVAELVALGLQGAINKLTTLVNQDGVNAEADDLICDSWLKNPFGKPETRAGNNEKECNRALNPNDLSRFGQRLAATHRFIYSPNPYFERLRFFLHDERMTVAQGAARDCERHTLLTYENSLWQTATSGDYITYLRLMNNDHLLHLRSLDGASNSALGEPNENYAREFWELGTVGPTDLAQNPVYNDLDIGQSALAFTGWTISTITVNGNQVCVSSRAPLLHTPGNKTIFIGTPWQATVENDEDVLLATIAHPRTAEHLAEDLWKQFINQEADATAIRSLAAIIRENNYNLHPAMKKIMASKALYAPRSRFGLLRSPIERLAALVKVTGFPLDYREYDSILQQLEQQPYNPPSVFGWDEKKLLSDQSMLEWRNVVVGRFMNINTFETKRDRNWSYYDRFVASLHAQGQRTSRLVIERAAKDFGVMLTEPQIAQLEQLMNFRASNYQCPAQCAGKPYRLYREAFDTDPSAVESGTEWNGMRAIRQLITVLLTSRDFLTK